MLKKIIPLILLLITNNIYALNLSSKYVAVYNETNNKVLYQKNSNTQVPIASITKLLTAIVTLESNQDLNQTITITNNDKDYLKHTWSRLYVGTKLTKQNALLLMLMSSENRAASALLRNYPGGYAKGILAIQNKIQALNLQHTRIVDANGLNPQNVSSSTDLLKIVKYAAKFDKIRQFSTSKRYNFDKKLYINSNPIVRYNSFNNITLSKTGFINEAGMCLVMRVKIKSSTYIMVFLGSPSKQSRVNDAKATYRWLKTL
jgi:D-alanyl-D-alanine endopeptidase (penicillin-binding protein 7)